MEKQKFKVGDKVRCVKKDVYENEWDNFLTVGSIYEVHNDYDFHRYDWAIVVTNGEWTLWFSTDRFVLADKTDKPMSHMFTETKHE